MWNLIVDGDKDDDMWVSEFKYSESCLAMSEFNKERLSSFTQSPLYFLLSVLHRFITHPHVSYHTQCLNMNSADFVSNWWRNKPILHSCGLQLQHGRADEGDPERKTSSSWFRHLGPSPVDSKEIRGNVPTDWPFAAKGSHSNWALGDF